MLVTTDFEAVLEAHLNELDPHTTEGRRAQSRIAFISGMQAGAAVLQNRMAITSMEVSRGSDEQKQNILSYLVKTANSAQIELGKMNEDKIGVPCGHA